VAWLVLLTSVALPREDMMGYLRGLRLRINPAILGRVSSWMKACRRPAQTLRPRIAETVTTAVATASWVIDVADEISCSPINLRGMRPESVGRITFWELVGGHLRGSALAFKRVATFDSLTDTCAQPI
jgi:hypothetical protein